LALGFLDGSSYALLRRAAFQFRQVGGENFQAALTALASAFVHPIIVAPNF
jgi:hypothetical protein